MIAPPTGGLKRNDAAENKPESPRFENPINPVCVRLRWWRIRYGFRPFVAGRALGLYVASVYVRIAFLQSAPNIHNDLERGGSGHVEIPTSPLRNRWLLPVVALNQRGCD